MIWNADRINGAWPLLQVLPWAPPSAASARQWIQDEHLTFRLDGAAADVQKAGGDQLAGW